MIEPQIVVVAHDMRSTHNVGSLLRTCEGLGIQHIYFTGYTPYPRLAQNDPRLPHIADKLTRQIHKTALDAESLVSWSTGEIESCMIELKNQGYIVAALEQSDRSTPLPDFKAPLKIALLLGREVEGIEPELLAQCDVTLEIPMFGQKESFNVVQAAAMALYQFRFSAA